MLLNGNPAMSERRHPLAIARLLAGVVLAGCDRKPRQHDPPSPLPKKIKPENIPDGGGAA
jgi:hypothetical protein